MLSYPEASRLLRVPVECPEAGRSLRAFSIDTRTLREDELFIALTGQHTDGHRYVTEAYEKGASGILVDIKRRSEILEALRAAQIKPRNILAVGDPQRAMTELATYHRAGLKVKTVGIVGSVGKTTTKEFLYFLLKQKFPATATIGNLNNHLGVPIMLSRLESEHRFAVMELGANHVGEIAYLSGLIKPSAAVLSPIGPAHLEGFGSLEGVYQAKTEIVDFLEKNAPLAVPDHDEYLRGILKKKGKRFVMAGPSEKADYRVSEASVIGNSVHFTVNGKYRFSFPGQALFLTLNAALAIAMADQLGIPLEEMPRDWQDAGFASGRFRETIFANGIRVIDDSYNASPLSFAQGLEAFAQMPCSGKKIVVFADMLELGQEEDRLHRELGAKIAEIRVDHALAYGTRSRAAVEAILSGCSNGCAAKHFPDSSELVEHLKDVVRPGDLVYLKGSRGMRVEKVLERLHELVFSAS